MHDIGQHICSLYWIELTSQRVCMQSACSSGCRLCISCSLQWAWLTICSACRKFACCALLSSGYIDSESSPVPKTQSWTVHDSSQYYELLRANRHLVVPRAFGIMRACCAARDLILAMVKLCLQLYSSRYICRSQSSWIAIEYKSVTAMATGRVK